MGQDVGTPQTCGHSNGVDSLSTVNLFAPTRSKVVLCVVLSLFLHISVPALKSANYLRLYSFSDPFSLARNSVGGPPSVFEMPGLYIIPLAVSIGHYGLIVPVEGLKTYFYELSKKDVYDWHSFPMDRGPGDLSYLILSYLSGSISQYLILLVLPYAISCALMRFREKVKQVH